jgi:hypothetical protein
MEIPSLDPSSAHTFYSSRHASLQSQYDSVARLLHRLQLALIAAIVLTLATLVFDLRGALPSWPVLASFLATLVLINRYLHARGKTTHLLRLLDWYERAIARVDGSIPQSGHTGESFRIPGHLYDVDLNVLGPDSLFGLLATVRTGIGRLGLARYLLAVPDGPPTAEEILLRRGAVQELTPQNPLREQIALLGPSRFQQVEANHFDPWLNEPPQHFPRFIRPCLSVTSTLTLLMLLLGLTGLLPWSLLRPNLLLVLAIQSAIGLYLRPKVVPILNSAARLSQQVEMFRDGLTLLQSQPFHSARLQALQQASQSPQNAVPLIARLQHQLVVVDQRTKEWYLIPSLLLCLGTHAALSINAWKQQYALRMKQWLAIWAEFETLNAIATYAYEHPQNTYPEILPAAPAIFEATALAHPLLPASAVANDIALNPATSLYLISGSNMAGKSTLLRTIGLNAVLAATGAPIRATAARISTLALTASIALSDSLAHGKSKFLTEVERLHAILQLSQQPGAPPVLFLVDEIFSGTNSVDRRIAAEAVTRSLIRNRAIGALSTHDLTLTEIAAAPDLNARNVHMASSSTDDPLAFDYLLKPGVNPTSNALAIVRLMGIDL